MKKKTIFLKKISKITSLVTLGLLGMQNTVFADVVEEAGGGGSIRDSKIGQGMFNLVKDVTGTLQWILPVVGACFIVYYVIRIQTGEEQDAMRYKKSIIRVLICIVIGVLAVTIINLISKYFV